MIAPNESVDVRIRLDVVAIYTVQLVGQRRLFAFEVYLNVAISPRSPRMWGNRPQVFLLTSSGALVFARQNSV